MDPYVESYAPSFVAEKIESKVTRECDLGYVDFHR